MSHLLKKKKNIFLTQNFWFGNVHKIIILKLFLEKVNLVVCFVSKFFFGKLI